MRTRRDTSQVTTITTAPHAAARHWRRAVRCALAVAIGLSLGLPAAAAAADAPAPGTLVRSTPLPFYGVTRPATGTVGWRIEYASTSATGKPTTVSGAVLVNPALRDTPRALVGFAPGGHGLADKCAPSGLLRNGAEPDLASMDALLAAGNVVVVTDYEGLGMPGGHPFAVNVASARNVIDAVRAARALGQGGAGSDGLPIGLYGYSQGGGAVGSAVEQLPAYAPELGVGAAVVGGALADPGAVARGVDGAVWAGLGHAALLGFDSAYDLGLYGDLNPYGRHLMAASKNSCIDLLGPVLWSRFEWLFARGNPLRRDSWKQRLAENTLGQAKASVPVYQFHGTMDQILSYRDARRLRERWCKAGSSVRFAPSNLTEHFFTEPVMRAGAIRWLGDRLAGRPDRGNC